LPYFFKYAGRKSFSTSINKKTKLYYLGNEKIKKTKEYHENYLKLKSIIDEMTVVSMELLKLEK